MYETLLTKIADTLGQVTRVKEILTTPTTTITKYPAVFFKPNGFQNDFETNAENAITYRFMMIVIVGIAGTTPEDVFSSVLPKTVDDIVAQFNQDWNQGTIDGHRVRVRIDSADAWELSEEQDGLVAYAPLNIDIKLLTTN
jgi:hypothetical protein